MKVWTVTTNTEQRLNTSLYASEKAALAALEQSRDGGDTAITQEHELALPQVTQGEFIPDQPDALIVATITVEDIRNVAADYECPLTDEQAHEILEAKSGKLVDAFLYDWVDTVREVCHDAFATVGMAIEEKVGD